VLIAFSSVNLFAQEQILTDTQIYDCCDVSVAMNDNGDWIVAGGKGAYVNGRQILTDSQIYDRSDVSVAMNDNGDWIVAGGKGAYKGSAKSN
ncbi:hypothetical protein OAT67_00810, partial [Bacteriovoracaceae bacterium]|nr:hypothetical protein [Bacteriovoracaceae bacterium]